MLLNEIRRFAAWFTRSHVSAKDGRSETRAEMTGSAAFQPDPMFPAWHGDHWQNLLSSPMDARRYVMEDWSVPASIDWDLTDGAVPAH